MDTTSTTPFKLHKKFIFFSQENSNKVTLEFDVETYDLIKILTLNKGITIKCLCAKGELFKIFSTKSKNIKWYTTASNFTLVVIKQEKKEPEKLLTLAAIEILKFDIQVDSAIQKIFKDSDFTLNSKHIQELSSKCEKCNT